MVAGASEEVRPEAEEFGAGDGAELVLALRERLDRRLRAGVAAEVEVEVREVHQRLMDGDERAAPPPHVDRRLEVREGRL